MQRKREWLGSVSKSLLAIADTCTEIMPPAQVIHRCSQMAKEASIDSCVIGETERGKPIQAYRIGDGKCPVLLYGFPDPGEAVGGTGIVALMYALIARHPFLESFDVSWHMIPCLNFDDQPDEGRTLQKVMRDNSKREVDWCLHDPRKETTALVDYTREIRPVFSFPLHDEYHCGEPMDMYFGVLGTLQVETAAVIREYVQAFGVPVDGKTKHPALGDGFFTFGPEDDEYGNSTFSVQAESGPVFIAEVSRRLELSPAKTVALQLGAGLIAIASCIPYSGRGQAPRELFAQSS